MLTSIVVFCYLLIFNNGSIRAIYIVLIFIGFVLYIFTLGYVTKPLEMKIAKKMKFCRKKVKKVLKSFKKVLQSIYNIYYNITERMKRILNSKAKVITMAAKMTSKKSFKSFLSSKKNIPAIIVTILLVAAFIFFGVTVVNQNADISLMERQKEELAVKYEEQVQTNAQLQAVLDNEDKDDYIEQKAREKGYVKSDEIVFYDISASE